MMARQIRELKARMSPPSRARAQSQTKEMMAEMLLAELRKEAGLTQKEFADAVGVRQPTLSRFEAQDDMQISTLERLIRALGGELEIIAHMPRGDVRIRQFSRDSETRTS